MLLLLLATPAAAARVLVIDLRDSIQPASLRYVERGLREAEAQGAALVVIELDTPGGLVVTLRSMVAAILRSPTPVAVHVTPAGSRAASAGFFLVLAADVAAMAPGTNTGAAHPVAIGQQQERDVSMDKAVEDVAALARSLALQRGRSVEWAEKAVREALSYTATEALQRGLIDRVVASRQALLDQLDGVAITRPDGSVQTLALRGATVVALERTFAERVLSVLADPQIAYLLLMLGALGLLIELWSPGVLVAGIVGGLALLIGLYGFSLLPVNWVGALLMAAGIGLLIAEVFVSSYGLLGAAGLASFILGSLMLVDSPVPDLQIGIEVIAPTAAVLAAFTVLLGLRAIRSRRLRPQSGVEAMTGEIGELVAPIEPGHDGTVFVHGEYWTATAPRPLPAGAKVRIEHVDAHRLHVAPLVVASQGETV